MKPLHTLAFASALTHATKFIGDTLRTSIGHAGNVHRLGAQESTPTIISLEESTSKTSWKVDLWRAVMTHALYLVESGMPC